MSKNELSNNLPIKFNLLDENKKIIILNQEHPTILEQIKEELEADKYNSIVTIENFKVMKETAQDLNKTSKFISDFRIAKKREEMKDIDTFEANLKSYCKLIDEKQQTIKAGLEVFEEENKKRVFEVCKKYFEQLIEEVKLRVEFATKISISDMTLAGYVTTNGAISKKGKDEIEKRVNEKLTLQTKVDNRVLALENECYKQGIEPLTIEHIQGFLYEDDETYISKLQSLITAEKVRNERIKEQEKQKAYKQVQEEIKEVNKNTKIEEKDQVKEVTNPYQSLNIPEDGKVTKTLSINIKVPVNATNEQVISAVINMIKQDRFPLENIEVK